jgi:hypothetical protein
VVLTNNLSIVRYSSDFGRGHPDPQGRRLGSGSYEGSHQHFKHPNKAGIVTVPHPRKDIPIGTLKSIERQSGVALN